MNKNLNNIFLPGVLLRSCVDTLIKNPVIFYPFIVLGFIQLLILEVLYFFPRYPLNEFFNPLVTVVWSERFLHYPFNLILLPKMFYYAKIVIYFLLGNFCLAVAVQIIAHINTSKRISISTAIKKAFSKYAHLCACSLIYFGLIKFFSRGPAITQFIAGIIITTLLAYLVPIIICENKKILSALFLNLKILYSCPWTTLMIVLIPSLFYLPVLLFREHLDILFAPVAPDVQLILLAGTVLVALIIDAVIITALTSYYFFYRESA